MAARIPPSKSSSNEGLASPATASELSSPAVSSQATRPPRPSVLGTLVVRNQLDGSKEFQALLDDGSLAVLRSATPSAKGLEPPSIGKLIKAVCDACSRRYAHPISSELESEKELAEKNATISLSFIESILWIREVSVPSRKEDIHACISGFLTSLQTNPLTLREAGLLKISMAVAILNLDEQDKLHYLDINLPLSSSPYTITILVMALQHPDIFNFLLPLDPLIPNNLGEWLVIPSPILETCQKVILRFKLSCDAKSAPFQELINMLLPSNIKQQRIEQETAKGFLEFIKQYRSNFKVQQSHWEKNPVNFNSFSGTQRECEQVNEVLAKNTFGLTSEILEKLEHFFNYYQDQMSKNRYFTFEPYFIVMLVVIYHNIKARSDMGEHTVSTQILLKINSRARTELSKLLDADKELRNRMLRRLLGFLQKTNYGVLSNFSNDIPLALHSQFEVAGRVVFSHPILGPINKKYEDLLVKRVDKIKHILIGLLREVAYNSPLLEGLIQARLDDFFQEKRELFQGMYLGTKNVSGFMYENTSVRFMVNLGLELALREKFTEIFVKIQESGRNHTRDILEEIQQSIETKWSAAEKSVDLIIKGAPPGVADDLAAHLSHEEVAKADKKTAKNLKQTKKREKKLAADAKTAVERQKQHEEVERLKQLAEKKLIKDQLLTAINKLELEDDLACLRDILNNGPALHRLIDEDVMTKFLKEKLEINARSTGAGHLFTIGSTTLTFHRSHGRDRSGTLDGGFLKELRDALNGVGLTSADIPKIAVRKADFVI
jgi:hypothetical protein